MIKAKYIRQLDMGEQAVLKKTSGLEVPVEAASTFSQVEKPGQLVNGMLGHTKFALKEINFFKKAGFYDKAFAMMEELCTYVKQQEDDFVENSTNAHRSRPLAQLQLKFRIVRDKARILALLNRNDDSLQLVEEAE